MSRDALVTSSNTSCGCAGLLLDDARLAVWLTRRSGAGTRMHLVPRPFARPGSAASSSQGFQTTRYAMRVVVAAGIQRQNIGAMAKKDVAHSRLLKSPPPRANFGSSGGSLVPSSLDVRLQDLSLFAPPEMVQKESHAYIMLRAHLLPTMRKARQQPAHDTPFSTVSVARS